MVISAPHSGKIGNLGVKEGEDAQIPMDSVHAVTVPGAAAGWVDCVERFGSRKLSMEEVLAPAIELAEKGFPVSELSATFVSSSRPRIDAMGLTAVKVGEQ